MALISVAEAAGQYGLSGSYLRRLLADGTIRGQKVGPVWALDDRSLRRFLSKERKPGPRPKSRSRRA